MPGGADGVLTNTTSIDCKVLGDCQEIAGRDRESEKAEAAPRAGDEPRCLPVRLLGYGDGRGAQAHPPRHREADRVRRWAVCDRLGHLARRRRTSARSSMRSLRRILCCPSADWKGHSWYLGLRKYAMDTSEICL